MAHSAHVLVAGDGPKAAPVRLRVPVDRVVGTQPAKLIVRLSVGKRRNTDEVDFGSGHEGWLWARPDLGKFLVTERITASQIALHVLERRARTLGIVAVADSRGSRERRIYRAVAEETQRERAAAVTLMSWRTAMQHGGMEDQDISWLHRP